MERRKFIIGAGALAAGATAAVGTGAFSRVEAKRDVRVQVTNDEDAYLAFAPVEDSPNSNYVDFEGGARDKLMNIDISEDNPTSAGGLGVNSAAITEIDDLFQIKNRGMTKITVEVDVPESNHDGTQAPYVTFHTEDGEDLNEAELELEPGESEVISMHVDTIAWEQDQSGMCNDEFSDCDLVDGEVSFIAESIEDDNGD